MFGSIGAPEILLVLGIGLLLFGARRLPEIGRSLGKGIREFKKATKQLTSAIDDSETSESKTAD
ncbi:MAG: twin-arginine translocase TatA/TatE family subunit [bacterium]|nr:twin-arginine translocase TatA/TatE family subunit [bacterium]